MSAHRRTILCVLLLPVTMSACSDADPVHVDLAPAIVSEQVQAKSDDRVSSRFASDGWLRGKERDEEDETDDEDEVEETDDASSGSTDSSEDQPIDPAVGSNQPDDGRLVASNCFGCHGTDGRSTAGFDDLAGESLSEKMMEMRDKDDEDIMIIHSRGYNNEQIRQLSDYFARVPSR